jgi:hypothetical protein
MTVFGYEISRVAPKNRSNEDAFKTHCLALGAAVSSHNVGDTTAKVQQLIMQYYQDVQGQSTQSFKSAKSVALLGFALFAATISYLIFTDLMPHIRQSWFRTTEGGMGVGTIGLISGSVVELIAGTQFFLYRNSAKQFGAFHICLERTHRYLLAYTMADQIGARDKDKTLEKIVCIMANAPMITQQDIEGVGSSRLVPHASPGGAYQPEVSLSHTAT